VVEPAPAREVAVETPTAPRERPAARVTVAGHAPAQAAQTSARSTAYDANNPFDNPDETTLLTSMASARRRQGLMWGGAALAVTVLFGVAVVRIRSKTPAAPPAPAPTASVRVPAPAPAPLPAPAPPPPAPPVAAAPTPPPRHRRWRCPGRRRPRRRPPR